MTMIASRKRSLTESSTSSSPSLKSILQRSLLTYISRKTWAWKWDSLDNVEIVMALEEEFKLEIPDKEADKIDSGNLAIDYVHNHPLSS